MLSSNFTLLSNHLGAQASYNLVSILESAGEIPSVFHFVFQLLFMSVYMSAGA